MPANTSSSQARLTTTDEFFMVKGAVYHATAGLVSGSVSNAQLQFLNAAGSWEDYSVSDGTLPFADDIVVPQSGYIRWVIAGTNPVVDVDFVQLDAAAVADAIASGVGVTAESVLTAMEAMDATQQGSAKVAIGVPFYSVLDYGADNTGVADSTTAVNDALAAAKASTLTRTVFFPPGTYKFNVDVPEGVQVLGCGTALQSDSPSGQHQTICIPADDSLPCFWVKYGTGQSIKGMAFEGNGNGTSVAAIKIMTATGAAYGGMGVVCEQLFVSGFTRGIETKNANMLRFVNCTMTACGTGAYVYATDTTIFENCSLWDNVTLGLYGNRTRGLKIIGGDQGQQAVPLMDFENSGTVEIANIHVEGMTGSHIIKVSNVELHTHDCSWLGTTANQAWIRKTYFQFGVTIGPMSIDGIPAHTGTNLPLLFETEDATTPWTDLVTFAGNMKGTCRRMTDGTYTTEKEVIDSRLLKFDPLKHKRTWDDFEGGTSTTGSIGDTGWNFFNYVGSGSMPKQAGEQFAPGVSRLLSGAIINNVIAMHHNAGTGPAWANAFNTFWDPWEIKFRVKLTSATNARIHIGVIGGNQVSGVPDEFVGCKLDTAVSPNWKAGIITSSVAGTDADTGSAAETSNWHTIRIRCLKAGEARIAFDEGTEAVFSSGVTTGVTSPGAIILTLENNAKGVNFDYYLRHLAAPDGRA